MIKGIKEFFNGIGERKLSIYATSGCYYMFMSLVPILMIICCILPYTPFNQATILGYIDTYFSADLGKVMSNIVNDIYSSSTTTITVSILLTLYSASSSMQALMRGMNTAYNIQQSENFIVFSIKAVLYMVILMIAMILSLVVMVYGGKILEMIHLYIPDLAIFDYILSNIRYAVVMIMLVLFFDLLYTLMPSKKMNYKKQLPGSIFTAILWVGFSYGYTIYVNLSDSFGAYGMIGTIMVAMVWIYYCFYFLLIGGYINSYLIEKKK